MVPSAVGQDKELLIAAASDLARAQAELCDSFTKASGITARVTLGASGMLARQIDNGAPFDVYLSANEAFVTRLRDSGKLLPDSVRPYASGRLAVWSRSGLVRSLADLAGPEVRHVAIANPLHAPYGMAAAEALRGQGLWERLHPRLVYGESVQQALQYAESGNADATITAWSLVRDRGGVLVPGEWHATIRQAGGVVRGSRHERAAREFLEFLSGPKGRQILQRYGFGPPR